MSGGGNQFQDLQNCQYHCSTSYRVLSEQKLGQAYAYNPGTLEISESHWARVLVNRSSESVFSF